MVLGWGCNDVSSECCFTKGRSLRKKLGLEAIGKPSASAAKVPTFLYAIRFPADQMTRSRSVTLIGSVVVKLGNSHYRLRMSALIRHFSRSYSVCKFPKTVNKLGRFRVTRSIPCSVRFRHGSLDVSKMTVVEKIVHDNIKVCF